MAMELSQEDRQFYEDNGYIVIRQLLDAESVQSLKAEQIDICRGKRGEVQGVNPDQAELPEEELLKRHIAIHFPHKISDPAMNLIKEPKTAGVLTSIVGPDVKCVQSMMFMKGPGKKGQAWHQDEYYIPTRDRSLTASWIALDRADIENGCLWVIPGSHKSGVIYPTRVPDTEEFDGTPEAHEYPYSEASAVAVELEPGDGVFFNGYLLHRSLQNKSEGRFRRAFANHYMSATSMMPWNWDGRLAPQGTMPLDVRDFVMVAGKDHYSHKPMQDAFFPFVRGPKHAELTQNSIGV